MNMEERKARSVRERDRHEVRKPNTIVLTIEQMKIVTDVLHADGSKLITQRLWSQLEPLLNMNKLAYARRSTLSGFEFKTGFDWDEYEWGKHSAKARVQIRCIYCNMVYIALARKLFMRQHRVEACPKCYARHHLYDDGWRARNAASQSIAQNRPETIEKHRANSSALWRGSHGEIMRAAQKKAVSNPVYKANMAKVMRNKWASDPAYRDRVNGKGVFKHSGVYDGTIRYHSKLELAFLLWCVDNRKHVQRCEFSIPYIDPNDGLEHDYYPDFIVDGVIVEVKGQRWIDVSPLTYRSKIESLSRYCIMNDMAYRVVLDSDLKAYTKKAYAYHEAQKQSNATVQG